MCLDELVGISRLQLTDAAILLTVTVAAAMHQFDLRERLSVVAVRNDVMEILAGRLRVLARPRSGDRAIAQVNDERVLAQRFACRVHRRTNARQDLREEHLAARSNVRLAPIEVAVLAVILGGVLDVEL